MATITRAIDNGRTKVALNEIVKTWVETITPSMAEKLLGTNNRNRNLSRPAVNRFAAALSRGEWTLNGETIKVSASGRLLDGQHRLAAVVQSGVPMTTLVVSGLPDATQETMDTGAKRKLGDVLKLRGESSPVLLAATLRNLYTYRHTGRFGYNGNYVGANYTHQALIALLDEFPEVREHVSFAHAQRHPVLVQSHLATLRFIFSKIDEDDAEAFVEGLLTGSGLDADSAILAARNKLLAIQVDPNDHTPPSARVAITIKAWNAWRAGEPRRNIYYRPGGARGERFPIVDGDEFVENRTK